MKKYSDIYFEKKYKILLDKLVKKEGFIDEVKKLRHKLSMPVDGFPNEPELAHFLVTKMRKAEKQKLTMWAFLRAYENEQKRFLTDDDKGAFTKAFMKKHKGDNGIGMIPMMVELGLTIDSHHQLFTKYPLFLENKYHSTLYAVVFKLMQKYWGVDLLDDHIIFHYIEKYFFLGMSGVNQYIKNKVSCHNCRYLGVYHFSPTRFNMDGRDEGPFSKNYTFNKDTVKMLSQYFNSVFVIIKPYATKELVLQYIEDNWDDLKDHIIEKNTVYKQFGVHPSIIKESDDEKNRLVYELNKSSKKELLKLYRGEKDYSHSGIYKENIISAILNEEYEIEMSSDAVKKSASRYAKSIKLQRQPKDIRDI